MTAVSQAVADQVLQMDALMDQLFAQGCAVGASPVLKAMYGYGSIPAGLKSEARLAFMLAFVAGMAQPKTYVSGFLNSWAAYGLGYEVPGYRRNPDGMVVLSGSMKSGTVDSPAFALPVGFRPASALQFPAASLPYGLVGVLSNGSVVPVTPCNNSFVSLDGVQFLAEA